ncbi:hypothetical protein PFICI_09358 [Pestalotiopsis fici W106-1]|uniref:Myb-like DNA-binding domain-containing protein n=1 Tax=Pestalotiopsis fici (strain W106-1 / CGMCC3.15140) TaxID=1229662 RepID=W3X074_PESFW|nr:uncharacterized protein PFICI_09358 [Pestalotiopsis fici W106-1]ETS79505.1 hypothetical protein PFICI_09358 [Pestalotiopsis fici W106-1]
MSNNDNVMARFLFAILQQKNLKDIDWNKVASNPILAQEITNGHAARMRYSRFRSAMLGLEPQRRNRSTKEKPNRVTKSKKEPKDQKSKKEEAIKTESLKNLANATISPSQSPAIPMRIKQEGGPSTYHNNRMTPTPIPMISAAPTPHTIQPRLLTPCSDTDGFPASPAVTASPTAEMLNPQPSYDFPMGHFSHDPPMWSNSSPMFPPYEHSFTFEPIPISLEHQAMHHHSGCATVPSETQAQGEYVHVKHEHWDNHCT